VSAKKILLFLRNIAIIGNLLYILWITWNGIDEGFAGTIVQKVSYVGIITLLILNFVLLYRKK
jgi:hypothetical protein